MLVLYAIITKLGTAFIGIIIAKHRKSTDKSVLDCETDGGYNSERIVAASRYCFVLKSNSDA